MPQVVYPIVIFTPGSVNVGTSTFTYTAAGPILPNQPVSLALENPGALPAPLAQDVTYFAVSVTSTTFQLSLTSGGGAITLTTAGYGNMSLFASSVPVPPPAPSPPGSAAVLTPSGVNVGTSTFTYTASSPLLANQLIYLLQAGPGAFPAPLVQYATYYAVNVTGTTFQVSMTSGGAPITLSTAGSGNMTLFSLPAADAGPDFVIEASRAGDYPARHFDQRERKLLACIKRYADAAIAASAAADAAADAASSPPSPPSLAATLLGAYTNFSSLANAGVTSTGNTVITGDLGTSPTASVTGFPPGIITGSTHAADSLAAGGQTQMASAISALQAMASTGTVSGDLGGLTKGPGVYDSTSTLDLTGTFTLDAGGDPNAHFVIRLGSALTTAASSVVALVNGAQADNVFWLCGSAATLGASSTFVGNLLVGTAISMGSAAAVTGRVWAKTASITLIDNAIAPPSSVAPGSVGLSQLSPGIKPSHIVVFAGKHTTTGGAAAETQTLTGVRATDIVIATLQSVNAAQTMLTVAPTANTITYTFSADPSTNTVISYEVLRAAT